MEEGKFLNSYEAAKYNHPVDFMKIAKSIEYYKMKGFDYIEVPWDTPKKYRAITFSGIDFDPIGEDRYLVGSAEQSFIYLQDSGNLKRGSYVACTPCHRGDNLDSTHQQYFLKVELFDSNDVSKKRLSHIVNLAYNFFSSYIPCKIIEVTPEMFDIETTSGVELGSYGTRNWKGNTWIYGTGLAEPRLSKSMLSYN